MDDVPGEELFVLTRAQVDAWREEARMLDASRDVRMRRIAQLNRKIEAAEYLFAWKQEQDTALTAPASASERGS